MFTKNAILAVLVVMVTGAMAADKPAVEARLKMEACAQGKTDVVAQESAPVAALDSNDGTTKPAVAARRAREEAPAAVAVAEHPVTDVGYHPVVDVGYQRVESYGVPAVDMGTKPAVQARQK
jgi:hypothetical protein